MRVHELMTTDVVTATPDTALKDAARELAERGISGLPVVDADRHVLGVLSEADILAKEIDGAHRGSALQRFLEGAPTTERFHALTVGEAMSAPAITIEASRPVTEAAAAMLADGINRLPVVDAEARLVGVVTRADLVRAFARDDETIRAEIDRVLRHDLWLDPAGIAIDVSHGVVTLSGTVESEADARVVQVFARRVPGVVEVSSTLRYPDA